MKFIPRLSRNKQASTNNDPTISSLKSEELWQFIQRPEGTQNAETRAADLSEIWSNAQRAAAKASRGTGEANSDWAISS